MKKHLTLAATITIMIVIVNTGHSQNAKPTISITGRGIINFKQLADKELISPPKLHEVRDLEEEKNIRLETIPRNLPVSKEAKVTEIKGDFTTTIEDVPTALQASPEPNKVFNGLIDNLQKIPPDVMGAAGPQHLFETLNTEYRIFNKSGKTISTLSLDNFWSGLQSVGYPFADPHVVYDANASRWFTCMLSHINNGHYGFFVAVSETSDPTGNWYEYAFDVGNGIFSDYPLLGYNKKWLVITTNDFVYDSSTNSYPFRYSRITVINKTQLMANKLKTVNIFFDSTVYTLSPAETMDANEGKEYLLADYNGNIQGNGYLKMGTITGTGNNPIYSSGPLIGVNKPWGYNYPIDVDVPQKGSNKRIDANDPKMRSVIVRNGFVWATHTIFLPVFIPKRASSDWWQINPSTQKVIQYGRLDDASSKYQYSFASMAVTATNDVLIGASAFSKDIYASAVYAYRASTDAPNSVRIPYIYQYGKAPYYKPGGDRNRWGDYSATCIDPSDGTFWTIQEYAYTPTVLRDRWATVWANVSPAQPIARTTVVKPAISYSNNSLTTYPNPSKGSFILNFQSQKEGKATITVYNLTGKVVYNQEMTTTRGKNQLTIHLQNIASGNYIVTVQTTGEAKKENLIVVQ